MVCVWGTFRACAWRRYSFGALSMCHKRALSTYMVRISGFWHETCTPNASSRQPSRSHAPQTRVFDITSLLVGVRGLMDRGEISPLWRFAPPVEMTEEKARPARNDRLRADDLAAHRFDANALARLRRMNHLAIANVEAAVARAARHDITRARIAYRRHAPEGIRRVGVTIPAGKCIAHQTRAIETAGT